jgi:hypothetical protein
MIVTFLFIIRTALLYLEGGTLEPLLIRFSVSPNNINDKVKSKAIPVTGHGGL